MPKNTTAVGKKAEALAEAYLTRHGYTIVAKNWRDRFTELDLVAAQKDIIAFIEVKYRESSDFGGAVGAISADKQKRLTRAAEYWLSQHPQYQHLHPRIDVITIEGSFDNPALNHLVNALGN